jgi:hypothetical protein
MEPFNDQQFDDEVETFVETFERNLSKLDTKFYGLQRQVTEMRQGILILAVVALLQLWVIIYLATK